MNKSRTKQILKHLQYFQVKTYRVCSERTEEATTEHSKKGTHFQQKVDSCKLTRRIMVEQSASLFSYSFFQILVLHHNNLTIFILFQNFR